MNTDRPSVILSRELLKAMAQRDELLAELQHLVRLMEPLELAGTLSIPGLATLNGARAAIAKAEGK